MGRGNGPARDISLAHTGLVTQVVHWAYGTWWGALYALDALRDR